MRKLLVVSAAVLVLALILNACGGSNVSIQPGKSKQVSKRHATSAINISAFYKPGASPRANVNRAIGGRWVDNPAIRFITTPKGVSLKLSPRIEVVKAELSYMKPRGFSEGGDEFGYVVGHKYPTWDGKGNVPLTKATITNDGESRRVKLHEIRMWLYDPSFSEHFNVYRPIGYVGH